MIHYFKAFFYWPSLVTVALMKSVWQPIFFYLFTISELSSKFLHISCNPLMSYRSGKSDILISVTDGRLA